MYAKVIVDVPAKGTNRPFDYAVPARLREAAETGSRVEVPFGGRTVQGYIVALVDESAYADGKLKPISRVLDLEPPLTPELLAVGRWLSDKYMCHLASAYGVMLPGALKARTERSVAVSEEALAAWASERETAATEAPSREIDDEPEQLALLEVEAPTAVPSAYGAIIEYVRRKSPKLTTEELIAAFPDAVGLIKRLFRDGVLCEEQSVRDRVSVRTALTAVAALPPDELREAAERLPKQASKMKEALLLIAELGRPVRLAELTSLLPGCAGSVKSLAAKGFLQLEEVEAPRDPYAGRVFDRTVPLPLRPEQQAAYDAIDAAVSSGRHYVFLLHGVTGSGKTEVYLQSIQRCLDFGREAVVLVPEISLTPQMVERFKGRFGDEVAVLHSRLSNGERYDEWRKIKTGRVKVAIGARSAVFAPFRNIGLIVVDEEHESSYKQEETPKYHARDVAIKRAELCGAVVLLGSATPSLESVHETSAGRYKLLTMRLRASGGELPQVHIVDMREELKAGNRSMFSRGLHQALADRLAKGEQTVMLLNRRGYATFVMCRTCGFVAQCPHCDISLTYHRNSRTMRCHYCGYAEREAQECPSCSSAHIRHFGTGTQRVEEELSRLFPGIRVIRMDVDTTATKGAHEKLLNDFKTKKGDVLLGTQMVAKGLDFPDVTLVGVIAADTVLGLPDFRSGERTFQLLTQVAGRAGRHVLPGEVFVQTYMPEHYAIVAASEHDFGGFARAELRTRESRAYPPYHKLMLITFSHELVQPLMRASEAFVRDLRSRIAGTGTEGEDGRRWAQMEALGPVASPIPKLKDRYRFQCMVKYREESLASRIVADTIQSFEERFAKEKIGWSVDVDPQYLM